MENCGDFLLHTLQWKPPVTIDVKNLPMSNNNNNTKRKQQTSPKRVQDEVHLRGKVDPLRIVQEIKI